MYILISSLKMKEMRDRLLPEARVRALQEEIAGFLLDQVIDPKGEFHYPLPR